MRHFDGDQFDAVSKWVRDVNMIVSWQGFRLGHVDTRFTKFPNHVTEFLNQKCRVSLARRSEVGIDTEVNLHRTILKPNAAAPGEVRRLGHFRDFQYARVKAAGSIFLAGRHGKLNMIDSFDAHVR
jgi:hypothetical protein